MRRGEALTMENVQNMENSVGARIPRDRGETVGGDPRAPRDGWRKVRLGEICAHVCSGGTPKSGNAAFYDGGDIPWLNTKEVNFEDIYATEKFITQAGYDNSAAKWVEPNSVIIAMYGATAGKSCITKIRLTTNQACCNMQIDDAKADYRFVFYMVRSHYEKLASLAVGGAQQNLSVQFLKDYSISLPPLPIQQRIAEILGAYDDAIENNRRRITLLEKMARELYRERFVRRAGMLQQNRLGNLIEVCYGKDHKALADGKIPVYGSGGIMRYVDRALYSGEAVLIPRKGTLNNIMYVNGDFWTVDTMFYAKPKQDAVAPFVFYYLSSIDMSLLNSGTAVPSMTTEVLNAMTVDVPTSGDLRSFSEIFTLMYDEKVSLVSQNRNLARQRDRLLPRLLSGKLDVSKLVKEGV